MPNLPISALDVQTTLLDTDLLVVVDTTDHSMALTGTDKQITAANVIAGVKTALVTVPDTLVPFGDSSSDLTTDANFNYASSTVTVPNVKATTALKMTETAGTGQTISLQAPATIIAPYALTFPTQVGTNGQVLTTTGLGVLTFANNTGGDVVGPASSTDNAITVWDGTTGKLVKNSTLIVNRAGTGAGAIAIGSITTTAAAINAIAIGAGAIANNGSTNIAIGAGANNTSSGADVAIGGNSRVSAQGGISLGFTATSTNTGAIAIGYLAQSRGSTSIIMGYNSGSASANGANCVIVGGQSFTGTGTAVQDLIGLGNGCFTSALTTGANGAVGIGRAALRALTSGAKNTQVGYNGGSTVATTTGSNCTFVGYEITSAATVSNNTIVGANSSASTAGANVCILGQGSTASATGCIVVGNASSSTATNAIALGENVSNSVASSIKTITSLATTTGNPICYNVSGQMGPSTSPTFSTITNTGTLTLPTSTDTLVGQATTDTLTNKTLTGTTNVIRATQLATATTDVVISGATAPTSGQVLTATSGTAATWQTPSGGGGVTSVNTLTGVLTLTQIAHVNDSGSAGGTDAYQIGSGASAAVQDSLAWGRVANTANGQGNIAFGAGSFSTGGTFPGGAGGGVAIGLNAGSAEAVSIAIGAYSMGNVGGSAGSLGVGYTALYNLTSSGTGAVGLGLQAGFALTDGANNTIIGHGAVNNTSTNGSLSSLVAVGKSALSGVLTTGANGAVGVGYLALNALTSGAKNTFGGYNGGSTVATDVGSRNTGWGYGLVSDAAADDNTLIGNQVSASTISGATGLGSLAFIGAIDGVALGRGASSSNGTGNVALGADAQASGTTTGAIAVGYGAVSSAQGAIALGQGVTANVTNAFFMTNSLASTTGTAVMFNASGQIGPLTSSLRFKKNIKNARDLTKDIDSIRVVEYDRKETQDHEIGLIAEEMVDIYPEIVPLDLEGRPFSVDYARLTMILIQEVQSLRKRVNALEKI